MTSAPDGDTPSVIHSAWPERLAAAALFALGVVFLLRARAYGIGAPHQMGPGYFPAVLGAALCLLAMLIALTHRKAAAGAPVAWRPVLMIAGGMVTFILAMPHVGLMPALFLCTLIVSRADRHTTPVQSVAVASFLAIGAGLLFIQILGLPIPAFGSGQ